MRLAKKPALRRLWTIDRELRKKGYPTAEQLARLNEVDTRTARRDIESLRDDHGAPVKYDAKRRGWYYTSETYRLPAVVITEGELVALFLAGQALCQVQGTKYETDLQWAFRKLAEFLPDEVSLHWDSLEQAQSFRQSVTTPHDVDRFHRLADAVLHRRQLRIRYWTASRNEETERTIDPLHLAAIDGEFFLIAWCHARKTQRMFAPARIRELQETGETFDVPSGFHVGEFFDGSFRVVNELEQPVQTVRLRFAPSAAKYVKEKIYHPSQENLLHDDGAFEMTMSLRSLIEIRRFALSWGSECEVLEPGSLREDIRREAEAILKQSRSVPKIDRVPSRTRRAPRLRKETA